MERSTKEKRARVRERLNRAMESGKLEPWQIWIPMQEMPDGFLERIMLGEVEDDVAVIWAEVKVR